MKATNQYGARRLIVPIRNAVVIGTTSTGAGTAGCDLIETELRSQNMPFAFLSMPFGMVNLPEEVMHLPEWVLGRVHSMQVKGYPLAYP